MIFTDFQGAKLCAHCVFAVRCRSLGMTVFVFGEHLAFEAAEKAVKNCAGILAAGTTAFVARRK